MKLSLVLLTAIFLSVNTSTFVAHGQTRKGRASSARGRRTQPVKTTGAGSAAAKSSAVNTTPSGLIYVTTRRSNGRLPRPGETVIVHYTGVLSNGVKFDSSLDREGPLRFKLGAGQVIKGWDEGIAKLRVGEQATLVIPPQLGYGERGAGGVIPPNATLIFIVELIGIQEADAPN
jgi:FKBP-type peptidyl-prolyl cis-trans isomerase